MRKKALNLTLKPQKQLKMTINAKRFLHDAQESFAIRY